MGSRKTTKAAVILQGARERLAKAETVMNGIKNDFDTAQVVVNALRLEYDALERAFAREPSVAKSKVPRAPRKDKGSKRGLPTEAVSVSGPNPPPED